MTNIPRLSDDERIEAGIRGGLVVQDRRRSERMLDAIATPVIEVGDHSRCELDGEMCGECRAILEECLPMLDAAWKEGK